MVSLKFYREAKYNKKYETDKGVGKYEKKYTK